MPEDNKNKVTIQFGGYDDTPDKTIMFEGPIEVTKTVNSIDLLYTIDISQYETGSSVIVFVRNVNDPSTATKGEIPYRGSFYKYDWDTSGWIQIVLGNHSHSNMAILDQLGTINTDSMKTGEKKVISIEKIDPDEDDNIRTVDYKIDFEDSNAFPDVPEDVKGKPLYLSADKEGNFEWTNSFVPAQTFKILKLTVDQTNLVNNKQLHISQTELDKNNVYFNPDLNDEILLFDSGSLVNIASQKDDTGLTLNIQDNDTNLFEEGETLTLLVIRNGIAGLLDSIKEQYITKAEAIELLSNGTLNLNSYITRDDLKKYAAQINHTHSQYLRKNDYDIFDYRYADYQHTHSEYTTREQVLSIIADAAGETGEIDTDKIIETIVTNLENKIHELDTKYYNKEQVDAIIESAKKEVSNSDAIEVTFDGRNLTEYLRYLDNKQNEILHVDADTVELEADKVNLGEGESLGGLNNGEEIVKGSTLTQFIHRLITKEKVPELKQPELSMTYYLSDNDAGNNSSLSVLPKFVQNNAGNLNSLILKIYTSETDDSLYLEKELYNNEEEIINNLIMNAYDESRKCFRLVLTASYNDGPEFISNIGKKYQILKNSISQTFYLYNTRKIYLGTISRQILEPDDLTSDDLYDLIYNSSNNTIHKYELNEENYKDGLTIDLPSESKGETIIFAIPEQYDVQLSKIVFLNQNIDMSDDFSYMNIIIPDKQDQSFNNLNNYYNLYYYTLSQPIISDLSFKLYFRKAED